jgi:O-antigen ligase
MARTKASIEIEPTFAALLAPWLTRAAFVLTLMVAIARGLFMESTRDAQVGTTGPAGPGAATTIALDALCCIPALLVLLRRALERDYIVRWSWSHVLLAALAAWAALSVAWANDKFAAIIASANLVAAAALVWSTTQLVRSWLRLRIVAGMCFGLLLVYWAHGLIYKFIDAPHHQQFWNENKEQILRERGWEAGSAIAKQFERKFVNGEIIGFNESPNSFSAVIVLLTVVSIGLAIQRRASGDSLAWTIAIAAACAPGLLIIYFAGTRTAAGTLLIAAAALASLASVQMRRFLQKHHNLAFSAGIAVFFLGAALLVAHGIYHGSLPNDSLNFRWRYWIAAAELVKRHLLTGVGWANFGQPYLAVRVPAAAEEVRDPHNFIVRAFAELGIIGGALVLLWLMRAAWELTRPINPPPTSAANKTSLRSGVAMAMTTIAGGIALAIIASIDFAQNSDYVLLEVFRRVLYLGLLCVGMIVAMTRTTPVQDLDDRPSPWVLYGLIIALGVFFVHNLMDFALGEAGAMTLFAVLLGAGTGARMPSAAGARRRPGVAVTALGAATALFLIALIAVVVPIIEAEQQADAADRALAAGDAALAAGLFNSAYQHFHFNADYAYREVIALVQAGAPPQRVKAALDVTIATNPMNVMYYLARARYELRQPTPDVPAIRADFDTALALDPQNIEVRLEFAELLSKWNDRATAAQHLRKALDTNAGYDPAEPERLPPERVRQIEAKISALQS